MKKIDHSRGLCGKPDVPANTPLEEAKEARPHCLCCGAEMQIVTDGGSLEQLGVYALVCPDCPPEEKK